MTEQAIPVKLVVVGDGCVGKTSLLVRLRVGYSATLNNNSIRAMLPPSLIATLLLSAVASRPSISVFGNCVFMVRDTAGQEEYQSLRPLSYSNCDIFLIVFSVVDKTSFSNAKQKVVLLLCSGWQS